jgi:membrane-associated phospholipid phosphatase
MLAVFAPVLLATYLASTLVLGHHHHAYDVIFGSLIGGAMSMWAYKMVFVSLWDGRMNSAPLAYEEKNTDLSRTNADNEVLPTSRPGAGSGL